MMQCFKCKGLMLAEWVSDYLVRSFVWRCLNCGLIADQYHVRTQQIVTQRARSLLAALNAMQRYRPALRRTTMRRDC